MLGCERGGKYKKKNSEIIVTGIRKWKCDCVFCFFKLRGKQVHNENDRLKFNEDSMVIDMIKSLVKLINILFNLKDNNEDNVTIINIQFCICLQKDL